MAWLVRIARNRALDRLGHDAHESPPLSPLLLETLRTGRRAGDTSHAQRAGELPPALPAGLQRMQRLCVYLAYVEGLSQPDVAARLQCRSAAPRRGSGAD